MLTASDHLKILAAVEDYSRSLDDDLPITVRLVCDALDALLRRLRPLSVDGVKVQAAEDSMPFGLLFRLLDVAAVALADVRTTQIERAKLIGRLQRAYGEISRLRIVLITDETGELRITVLRDEPADLSCPDCYVA